MRGSGTWYYYTCFLGDGDEEEKGGQGGDDKTRSGRGGGDKKKSGNGGDDKKSSGKGVGGKKSSGMGRKQGRERKLWRTSASASGV